MSGKKKNSIKELATEVKELIANAGQSEDNIHTNCNAYSALKRKIDNPDSHHYDDDIRRMKDLHYSFQLGVSIHNRQNKINAARKVAAATATAATTAAAAIATSNVTNTSIPSSASTLINGN